MSNPKFANSARDSTGLLTEILEDMGFGGLWRSCSFNGSQEPDKQCFTLTEKLIEVKWIYGTTNRHIADVDS
jgi:neurofibromin 1